MNKNYHEIKIIQRDFAGNIADEMIIPIVAGGTRPMLILNCIYDGVFETEFEINVREVELWIDNNLIYNLVVR